MEEAQVLPFILHIVNQDDLGLDLSHSYTSGFLYTWLLYCTEHVHHLCFITVHVMCYSWKNEPSPLKSILFAIDVKWHKNSSCDGIISGMAHPHMQAITGSCNRQVITHERCEPALDDWLLNMWSGSIEECYTCLNKKVQLVGWLIHTGYKCHGITSF